VIFGYQVNLDQNADSISSYYGQSLPLGLWNNGTYGFYVLPDADFFYALIASLSRLHVDSQSA
jgi:hypothetical protein